MVPTKIQDQISLSIVRTKRERKAEGRKEEARLEKKDRRGNENRLNETK